jgi:uncharacterized membrane protein YccC
MTEATRTSIAILASVVFGVAVGLALGAGMLLLIYKLCEMILP